MEYGNVYASGKLLSNARQALIDLGWFENNIKSITKEQIERVVMDKVCHLTISVQSWPRDIAMEAKPGNCLAITCLARMTMRAHGKFIFDKPFVRDSRDREFIANFFTKHQMRDARTSGDKHPTIRALEAQGVVKIWFARPVALAA